MSAYAWWCDRHRRAFDNYMSRGCPECEDERIARRVLALMRRDAEAAAQINASTEEEPT